MTNLAIIQVDLTRGRFGHGVSLLNDLAGKTVLQHTIDRVARIDGLDAIVLMHPADQSLAGVYDTPSDSPPITTEVMQQRGSDAWLHNVINSGRKWSLTAWRGGVGGMTVYDELLPAYPFLQVAQAHQAESLVLLRGDWCCVDPELATKQLELHRSAPDAMKVTFTQAPPGLSPLVVHHSVLQEMVDHNAVVANLLCYNPKKPAIDPMGKDVNVQVPASVRMQYRRFIYDTPRAIEHLQAVAERLGDGFADADAPGVTDASRAVETDEPWRQMERLPQQVNVELSPRRDVAGPIVPQHHVDLQRADMSAKTVDALFDSLACVAGVESASPRNEPRNESGNASGWIALEGVDSESCSGGSPSLHPGHPAGTKSDTAGGLRTPDTRTGSLSQPTTTCASGARRSPAIGNCSDHPTLSSDTAVLFGGLGDPLLHADCFSVLERATNAGLLGVGFETDLLVDEETIDRLATLPLDVIAVRINADSAATYEQLMGVDGYAKVMDNLQRLFKARNGNRQTGIGFRGWVVPRLVKVAENLSDLETFFERWMMVAGWAVVDRAKTGRGLIPDLSPVPMEVPIGAGSPVDVTRQKQRLTVLSDGTVCLCGEDWLGRLPLGSLNERGMGELWRGSAALADVSEGGECVCPSCSQWLEAQRRLLASAS